MRCTINLSVPAEFAAAFGAECERRGVPVGHAAASALAAWMGPGAPALAPAARVAPETMAAAVAELDAGDGRVARLLSALGWPVTRAHQMRAAAALVAAGGRRVHVSGGYVYRRQAAPQRARRARTGSRTLDLYADGMIGPEELRSRLATIDRDLGRLAVEADTAARQTAAQAPGARAEALALVGDLAHAWAHLAPAEQRDALAILASHVALARDEEPAPAWRTVEELTLRQFLTGGAHLCGASVGN